MPQDDDSTQPASPPSPPRPGRRPRPPRAHQSQQNRTAVQNPDPLAYDPGEGTSAQARAQLDPIESDSEDEYLSRLRRLRNWPTDSDQEDDPPKSPPPVAIPSAPAPVGPPIPDPHEGHTPPDPNLAACPCDPPSGPCAPVPQSTTTTNQQRPSFTPQPPTSQNPSDQRSSADIAQLPNNPVRLAISPHPRPVGIRDLTRRRARPNYGPSLSFIVKNHLGL